MCLIAQIVHHVDGFAVWMTKDFCHVNMEVGEVIMGDLVEESGARAISLLRVHENGTETRVDGPYYEHGDKLIARIDDSSGQFVIESSAGIFEGGGCEGRRISSNDAILNMPSSGNTTVSVKAGWALGHAQVMITKPVILMPSRYVDPGPQLTIGALRGVNRDGNGSYFIFREMWVAPVPMILIAFVLYTLGRCRGNKGMIGARKSQ